MASSRTEVANFALSHLGVGTRIANIETERSQEANACRQFFDHVTEIMLRSYDWPFATKIVDLVEVEEDPNDEWAFSYRYPSDCFRLIRIPSGLRNDTRASRIPYRVAQDDDASGKIILCDLEDAKIEYIYNVTQIERWPADFVLAHSFRLAAYIAPMITGADPFKMGARALEFFSLELGMAQANAANEEQNEEAPDTELIKARE